MTIDYNHGYTVSLFICGVAVEIDLLMQIQPWREGYREYVDIDEVEIEDVRVFADRYDGGESIIEIVSDDAIGFNFDTVSALVESLCDAHDRVQRTPPPYP